MTAPAMAAAAESAGAGAGADASEDANVKVKRKLEEQEENEVDDTIEQEYRIWKKNAPLLYDSVLTHCLTWPSLTADFLPDIARPSSDYATHRLVLGTQTADGTDNFLMVVGAKMPNVRLSEVDLDDMIAADGRLNVLSMMAHPGEVNRAVHCPKNSFLLATKGVDGLVRLFDYSKHPSRPAQGVAVQTERVLSGHTKEGFALAWSEVSQFLLASGAEDGKLCVWDVASEATTPVFSAVAHGGSTEAVSWSPKEASCVLTVGAQERTLKFWDVRASATGGAQASHKVSEKGEVNAAAWCPHNAMLVATAGDDQTVRLWDTRNFSRVLHEIEDAHEDAITNLKWSHFSECVLASSGNDRRVVVYDLARIGDEIVIEEPGDGVPEILFVHGGHTGRVNDFAWTKDDSFSLASVADDNILQVWQVAETVYLDEDEDAPDGNN